MEGNNNRIMSSRLSKGLTQKSLAEQADIAPASLSAYEKGQKMPPVDVAARIARVLNVSIDWLFGYERQTGKNAPNNLGDAVSALRSLFEGDSPVIFDTESYNWYEDPIGFTGYDAVMLRDMEVVQNINGVPDDSPKTKYAVLKIRSDKLADFFNSWTKLYKLLQDGEVEQEVYNIWIEKRINDLSNIPLPSRK